MEDKVSIKVRCIGPPLACRLQFKSLIIPDKHSEAEAFSEHKHASLLDGNLMIGVGQEVIQEGTVAGGLLLELSRRIRPRRHKV